MTAPIGEFGGWLRFFQVTGWIGFVLLVALAPLLLLGVFVAESMAESVYNGLLALDLLITAVFSLKILRMIKKKDREVPAAIIRYLWWIFGAGIVMAVLEAPFVYELGRTLGDSTMFFDHIKTSAQTLIYTYVWVSYFKKSARVAAYYTEEKIPGVLD